MSDYIDERARLYEFALARRSEPLGQAKASGVALIPADGIAGENTETLAGRMEKALQAVSETEKVEALVIGLGAPMLYILLAYAISVLSKSPLGILAVGLG